MPISAQEWRVRTGLINASRIRTVSVSRSSMPTVSVSESSPDPGPGEGEMVAWHGQPPQSKRDSYGISCCLALTELSSSTWKGWRALLLCLIAPEALVPMMITVLVMTCYLFLIGGKGSYTVESEAEGYVVTKFVSPFDSHPFLWIAPLAPVLILSFIVLWLLFKAEHRKASACLLVHHDHAIIVSPSAEGPLCRSTPILSSNVNVVAMLLLLSGDVETNPGPGQQVTLKNAHSVLYPARAKWRDIGIELEIDIGTLDSIERSCHFQDNNCLTRMLDYWLKQTDPPPSWDAIVEALESDPIGEGHLAEQVKLKYCTSLDKKESIQSGKSQCTPPTRALVDDFQKSPVAAACTTEYIKYLKAVYTSSRLPSDNKWPPTPSKHYINLAFVDKQTIARHEADEFTRYTIKGNIDDICHKKAPITIEKVACMQKIPFAYDPSQVEVSYPKLVLVTGAPGVGKTTFAWELCRKWGKGELLQHYDFVILLRLRDKNVRDANMLNDILFHQKKSVSESLAVDIEQRNGEGVLFILEGFDELPESMRVESSLYLDLIYGHLLPLATILVTSRPWAISDIHWECHERISQQFEILGFTKQQIDEYLISITLGDSNFLDELRRYISLNPPIHAAMYIPLNAGIVFEVYKDRRGRTNCIIPNTMTELYTAFSLTLLIRYLHDQGERVKKVANFESLPKVIYKRFLDVCKLACDGISNRQLIFSDLPDGFETLGFMQSVPELHFSSGVSVSYNFLHLTIQEFLAAYYLSLHPDFKVQREEESVTLFLVGITKLSNPAILPEQLPKYSVLVSEISVIPAMSYAEMDDRLGSRSGTASIITHKDVQFVSDDVVAESHVCLSASMLFYESQNRQQLQASIGTKTAFLQIASMMTPMECFAAGWCIGNSSCKWKLYFNEDFGCISPDSLEMLHAGIRKCYSTHPTPCCEVCELGIGQVSIEDGFNESLEMIFNLENVITFSVKRFVCLELKISNLYVASFCTQIKKMMCLEEVILDVKCGSMEANTILDVVLTSSSIGSLKLGGVLSEQFVKRPTLTNSTIHSLSLHFASKLSLDVNNVANFTTSLTNCKSLQSLAIYGHPFYIHGILLQQISREQIKRTGDPCLDSDPVNLGSYPCSSGEVIACLLQVTHASSLNTLTLQNCGLSQHDIAVIAQAVKYNKNLVSLDLSNNNCSCLQDTEVDPFTSMLRTNQTLRVLRVSGSNVDTNSLFSLLANNENATLITLDVRDNDYSVKNLADMVKNNKSLQCLQITVTVKQYNYLQTNSSRSSISDLCMGMLYSQMNIDTRPGVMAYIDESETVCSVCSTLVATLTKNTTLHDLMIHTRFFFYDKLVHAMQQCQSYEEVKERIIIHKHDRTGVMM